MRAVTPRGNAITPHGRAVTPPGAVDEVVVKNDVMIDVAQLRCEVGPPSYGWQDQAAAVGANLRQLSARAATPLDYNRNRAPSSHHDGWADARPAPPPPPPPPRPRPPGPQRQPRPLPDHRCRDSRCRRMRARRAPATRPRAFPRFSRRVRRTATRRATRARRSTTAASATSAAGRATKSCAPQLRRAGLGRRGADFLNWFCGWLSNRLVGHTRTRTQT